MKKRFGSFLRFAAAAAAVASLLVSCGRDAYVPAGYKRISPDSADYRFYVPSGWSDVNDGTICAAYVSATDRSSVSFTSFELNSSVIIVDIGGTTESGSAEPDTGAETRAPDTAADTDSSGKRLVTAEDYWEYYEDELIGTLGNPEYITKGENLIISGIESKKYEYTVTVTGTEYRFTQTVTVKNGTVYILTFTTTPDLFEEHSDEIDAIIGFVEIK